MTTATDFAAHARKQSARIRKAKAAPQWFIGNKPHHEPIQYRLGSTPLLNTAGILRWAISGYAFKADRKRLLAVFTEGYSGPNAPPAEVFDRLLRGEIPYGVEQDGSVIFSA